MTTWNSASTSLPTASPVKSFKTRGDIGGKAGCLEVMDIERLHRHWSRVNRATNCGSISPKSLAPVALRLRSGRQ